MRVVYLWKGRLSSKEYDDRITNDPVEETENKGKAYESLNGVGGFQTQAVSWISCVLLEQRNWHCSIEWCSFVVVASLCMFV